MFSEYCKTLFFYKLSQQKFLWRYNVQKMGLKIQWLRKKKKLKWCGGERNEKKEKEKKGVTRDIPGLLEELQMIL